jgi:hypothetical protein
VDGTLFGKIDIIRFDATIPGIRDSGIAWRASFPLAHLAIEMGKRDDQSLFDGVDADAQIVGDRGIIHAIKPHALEYRARARIHGFKRQTHALDPLPAGAALPQAGHDTRSGSFAWVNASK